VVTRHQGNATSERGRRRFRRLDGHAVHDGEQGKGLIIAGLTGVFIIGSLGTLFTIVYGMAV